MGLHDRRGLRGRRGGEPPHHRHPPVRALRGDRPDLLRAHLLPRPRGERRARVRPAPRRDGGIGPRRDRQVGHARPPEPRLPACAGGRDHARAHALRRRGALPRGHRAEEGEGGREGARDGVAARRAVPRLLRPGLLQGHLPRRALRDHQGEAQGGARACGADGRARGADRPHGRPAGEPRGVEARPRSEDARPRRRAETASSTRSPRRSSTSSRARPTSRAAPTCPRRIWSRRCAGPLSRWKTNSLSPSTRRSPRPSAPLWPGSSSWPDGGCPSGSRSRTPSGSGSRATRSAA